MNNNIIFIEQLDYRNVDYLARKQEKLSNNRISDLKMLKGTLTRDFLHAVFGIKTRPATPLFIP
jgi:hypothetical protein